MSVYNPLNQDIRGAPRRKDVIGLVKSKSVFAGARRTGGKKVRKGD
jgi:hypothetical protein